MRFLKEQREKRQLSQAAVALQCGMSRQHLSRLENGRALATLSQARALTALLGSPILCREQLLDEREMRELAGVSPFDLDLVNPEMWRKASSYWGARLRRLGLREDTWQWMIAFLHADSTIECYGLGQFAAKGGTPFLGNPNLWGFDRHVVVDRLGKQLGARLLPGLILRETGKTVILWPQVNLSTTDGTFRVDALMFYRRGSERYWLVLEFDGEGHNFANDAYRSERLDLMEVRISGDEIRCRQTFSLLFARADAAIAGSTRGAAAV